MFRRLLSAAVITSGLLLAVPASVEAQATGKVAVIKPAKVFQDLQETKDLRAKIEQQNNTLKVTSDEKGAKIKQIEAQLAELRRDSPSYSEKSRELRAARQDAQVWAQLTAADMENEEKAQTLALFRKIEAAIAEIAKARGIDVVLADVSGELPQNVDSVPKQQFTQFLNQKTVWYTAGAADLTNEVLAKLDADYKAAGQK